MALLSKTNTWWKRAQLTLAALAVGYLVIFVPSCSDQLSDLVGPSNSGLHLGIKAFYGASGLPNDGTSQATIRVEVFDVNNNPVTATVTLTTTLGTLGATSLTATNGVGVMTLTSVTTVGTAHIVASVENITATTIVPIVNLTTKVT